MTPVKTGAWGPDGLVFDVESQNLRRRGGQRRRTDNPGD